MKTLVTITMFDGSKHQIVGDNDIDTVISEMEEKVNHPSWIIGNEELINLKYAMYYNFKELPDDPVIEEEDE